jgi:hypothetical protein
MDMSYQDINKDIESPDTVTSARKALLGNRIRTDSIK